VAAGGKPEWRTLLERKLSAFATAAAKVQAAPAHTMPAAAAVDETKVAGGGADRAVDHNRPTDQNEEARVDHFAATAIHLGAAANHHHHGYPSSWCCG
jgi:hypothetical protein